LSPFFVVSGKIPGMNQKAKFVAFCENKLKLTEAQAQILYDGINEDPLGFKGQIHTAWPDVFEAPEKGTESARP